jgi:undecaprenyl-diphosphatase
MGTDWLHGLLNWVAQHPGASGAFVFAVAALEALPFLGYLVPGILILFGVGALIAAGAMHLVPTLVLAAVGAVAGDAAGYLAGRHLRTRLPRMGPFKKYPALIRRGNDFFARHGIKSILLGRFVGAVRPIVPTVAGAAGMRPGVFFAVDVPAAIAWAPCYILPGAVFGVSLGLAAQVATRLAVLLLLVVGIPWLMVWSTRNLYSFLQPLLERWVNALLRWSQRHRRLGRLGPGLADPSQPEAPALAILMLALIAGAWAVFLLVRGWSGSFHVTPFDVLVYRLFQHLHTPWSDVAGIALSQLGNWYIYGPLIGVIFVALIVARQARAAAHWATAAVLGATVAFTLQALAGIVRPSESLLVRADMDGQLILCTVVYAFLPAILTSGSQRAWPYYATAGTAIALTAFSRLYLGSLWFSGALISVGTGLLWSALMTLAYRRQRLRPAPTRRLGFAAVATIIASAALTWSTALSSDLRLYHQPEPTYRMTPQTWSKGSYNRLPAYRVDIEGRPRDPLNLQWLGGLDAIRRQLGARGWQQPKPLTLANTLLWLSGKVDIRQLPVLPQVQNGHGQALIMIYPIDAQGEWVLRLWPSRWLTYRGAQLWVGNVSLEKRRNWLFILHLPSTTRDFASPMPELSRQMAAAATVVEHSRARPIPRGLKWDGHVLLVTTPAPSPSEKASQDAQTGRLDERALFPLGAVTAPGR